MSRVVIFLLVATWYGLHAVESRPHTEGHRTHRAEVQHISLNINTSTTVGTSKLLHRVGAVHLVGPHVDQFHNMSKCQWHFSENLDENRIPRIIKEAKCVRPSSPGPHTCEDIKYNVLVQRVSESGELQDKIIPIKVGCATIPSVVAPLSSVSSE